MFADDTVPEELRRTERFLYVFEWLVIHCYPGQYHNPFGHCTQLIEHWRSAIRLLDVTHGHESFVDGLQELLIDGHIGGDRDVGFLRLSGDKQEAALLLEAVEDLGGLFGYQATNLFAGLDIFVDGLVNEVVELLDRLGKVLLGGGSRDSRGIRRRGRRQRSGRLIRGGLDGIR